MVIEVGRKTQEGATPASNQQPQPQDPKPQGDRRLMRRARAQGREARERIEEGGREANKRKKNRRVIDAMWKTGETRAEKQKKRRQERVGSVSVDPEDLERIERKHRGKCKALRTQMRTVERVCPLCRVWSEVCVTSIIDRPLGGSMRVAWNG